jgi:hypothetical protein
VIIACFDKTPKHFAERVSREYKKFLVVKAVENIVASKKAIPTAWKEKCQPTVLVDMFWHVIAMLSPRKYSRDCMKVIGDINDHEAGYQSPNRHAGSDYVSKRDLLFRFEREHFPEVDFFQGRLGNSDGDGTPRKMLFGRSLNHMALASEIMADMYGVNDCC